MSKTIGIVCEGPTDYILLKTVVDRISQQENHFALLQPEDDLMGNYGNGWKGVWKWCADHASFLDEYMCEITPTLDLIIIQMDGDVSRKEKEVHCLCHDNLECEFRGSVSPLECSQIKENQCPITLPCNAHGTPPQAYVDHLMVQIATWLGGDFHANKICPVIPCDSTDAWVVAAFETPPDIEQLSDPWEQIISRSKQYHGIRIPGRKKNQVIYRQLAEKVGENWERVVEACREAARFDGCIRAYFHGSQLM